MSSRVGERVALSSADRKRKSRRSRTEEKRTQDREIDAAARKRVRESRAEEDKVQDRAINAAFQRDKRGSSYADHRVHIETTLRRRQRLPPTSEQLLMHEQRCLSSLFMYYHRCGFENIAPAEEFAV